MTNFWTPKSGKRGLLSTLLTSLRLFSLQMLATCGERESLSWETFEWAYAKRLPDTKSINAGMQCIKLHLAATAEIAHTTCFSCGSSRLEVTNQPATTMDPLMAGVTNMRTKRFDFFELTGEPVDAKQSRVFSPPTSSVGGPSPHENPDCSSQVPGMPATTSLQAIPHPLPGSQATPAPLDTATLQAAPQSVVSSSTQSKKCQWK